jgi:hypothetical protein
MWSFKTSTRPKYEPKKVLVRYPSLCGVCEKDMESLRINAPFCEECLGVIKLVVNKEKKRKKNKKN